jgi:hypothetical protein
MLFWELYCFATVHQLQALLNKVLKWDELILRITENHCKVHFSLRQRRSSENGELASVRADITVTRVASNLAPPLYLRLNIKSLRVAFPVDIPKQLKDIVRHSDDCAMNHHCQEHLANHQTLNVLQAQSWSLHTSDVRWKISHRKFSRTENFPENFPQYFSRKFSVS